MRLVKLWHRSNMFQNQLESLVKFFDAGQWDFQFLQFQHDQFDISEFLLIYLYHSMCYRSEITISITSFTIAHEIQNKKFLSIRFIILVSKKHCTPIDFFLYSILLCKVKSSRMCFWCLFLRFFVLTEFHYSPFNFYSISLTLN